MDIPTKIKLAETYASISEAELAQLKTGKFSSADLENIAKALGAEFMCKFVFPDGTEI